MCVFGYLSASVCQFSNFVALQEIVLAGSNWDLPGCL